MTTRALLYPLPLLATALSCTAPAPPGGGLGGASGAGAGAVGPSDAGGSPGTDAAAIDASPPGDGSALPGCADPIWDTWGDVFREGQEKEPVVTNLSATVTVASMEPCSLERCGYFAPGTLYSLTAGADRLMLRLGIPEMPSNLIQIGDVFDLTVTADSHRFYNAGPTISQTIVLSRGGSALLFSVNLQNRHAELRLPDLAPFGIAIADEGIACEYVTLPLDCFVQRHAPRVTIGTDTAVLQRGVTTAVGRYSVTNGMFDQRSTLGSCHNESWTMLAGFRLP